MGWSKSKEEKKCPPFSVPWYEASTILRSANIQPNSGSNDDLQYSAISVHFLPKICYGWSICDRRSLWWKPWYNHFTEKQKVSTGWRKMVQCISLGNNKTTIATGGKERMTLSFLLIYTKHFGWIRGSIWIKKHNSQIRSLPISSVDVFLSVAEWHNRFQQIS